MFKRLLFGFALACSAAPALAITFKAMDSNHDGKITKEEFYGHLGAYSHWDRNDDGMIEKKEFQQGRFPGQFSDWGPIDGRYLDSKKFYDGLFSLYDGDDNGSWDKGEWQDAKRAGLFRQSTKP